MSKRLKSFLATLKYLHSCNKKEQKNWLKKHTGKDFILCICECAKNILKGKVPLSTKHKKRLYFKRNALRRLTLKKTSLKKKAKIIQSGGFLGALLGPIVSVLGSLFGGNNNN